MSFSNTFAATICTITREITFPLDIANIAKVRDGDIHAKPQQHITFLFNKKAINAKQDFQKTRFL